MITKILVVLTTDEAIPRSFYGAQNLEWPDGMDADAIERRIMVEAEGCTIVALDEYRRE